MAIRVPDIEYLLNDSSAGRNYEPVWKSIDRSQINFIAGDLDEK